MIIGLDQVRPINILKNKRGLSIVARDYKCHASGRAACFPRPMYTPISTIRCTILAAILLVASLGAACGTVKPRPGDDGTPAPGVSAGAGLFPHAAGWREAESHGVYVFQNNSEACAACHTGNASNDEGPPSCTTCHPNYPHEAGWIKNTKHGAWVKENGEDKCATKCHGTDLSGGLSKTSCTDCHKLYPHSDRWVEPAVHGEVARASDLAGCKTTCHGEDLKGGQSGVSCYDAKCHAVFPHAENWIEPSEHGKEIAATKSYSKCATECHGKDLKGGITGVDCASCHKLLPHPDGWEKGAGHGAFVLSKPDASSCRTQCHGVDLKGGLSGYACTDCHQSYPHSGTWLKDHRAVAKVDKDQCKGCHGDDFKTILRGKNCYSCHDNYPHNDATWANPDQHGTSYRALVAAGKDNCKNCHGAPITVFDSSQKSIGELNAKSTCYSICHWSYPHVSFNDPNIGIVAWKPDGHFSYLQFSTLLIDSAGTQPAANGPRKRVDDPILITPAGKGISPALENTCGGTYPGYCHNATRPGPIRNFGNLMCSGYCHK